MILRCHNAYLSCLSSISANMHTRIVAKSFA